MDIILLSGKMGSGKDFIAAQLELKLKQNNNKVEKIAFADPLRSELDTIIKMVKCYKTTREIDAEMFVSEDKITHLMELFDQDDEFNRPDYCLENRPKMYRDVMQYWGTDVRRASNKNYWVSKTISILKEVEPFSDYAIITDARFTNEVLSVIKAFPDTFTVRLEADNELREKRVSGRDGERPTNKELLHASETSIDDDSDFMTVFDMIVFPEGNNGKQLADAILNEALK